MSFTHSISPLDGRYREYTEPLAAYFSEAALFRYRLFVEIEYYIALAEEKKIVALRLTVAEKKQLRALLDAFSAEDLARIKAIEKKTKHDVKALEYFVKEKLGLKRSWRVKLEFFHFGLTSEDVNNMAYSLQLKESLASVYMPTLYALLQSLKKMARSYAATPLLSRTHGQPATPTTVGKEIAVFADRLRHQLIALRYIKLKGKLNGATGNFAAHIVSYPSVAWQSLSAKVVKKIGLLPNIATTQIEPHDTLVEVCNVIAHINSILIDFDRDMWTYISRDIFIQKSKKGEIGSSTMPHKTNPIFFENSEGNAGLANALLRHFAEKLPTSRMQRDLSDSTVLRNVGVGVAHAYLAILNAQEGLERVAVNRKACINELNANWEVLAEAVQTVLRKSGHENSYELLKDMTRAKHFGRDEYFAFVSNLELPHEDKARLLALTPAKYIGASAKLAREIVR